MITTINSREESRKRLAETIIKEGVFTGFNTFAWTIAGAMLSPMNGKSSGEGLGALAGAVSGIGLGIAKSREDTRRIEDDKKVSTLTMIKGAVLGAGFAAGLVGVYETAFSEYEKNLRQFVEKNQKLARSNVGLMSSSWAVCLMHQLVRLLPRQTVQLMRTWGVKRVHKAACAFVLKNYQPLNSQKTSP